MKQYIRCIVDPSTGTIMSVREQPTPILTPPDTTKDAETGVPIPLDVYEMEIEDDGDNDEQPRARDMLDNMEFTNGAIAFKSRARAALRNRPIKNQRKI